MISAKQLGVCIDDAGPHVMEHITGVIKTIDLPPLPAGSNNTGGSFKKSEGFSYDIELEQQTNYLSQLKSVIKHHDKLLLFGPDNLKVELYNLLREDNRFAKTSIDIKQTDFMTTSQQQVFVMDYFENI